MEKDQNRDIFLNTFDEFCNSIELTEKFLNSLRKYRSFRDNMRFVDKLKNINEKKFFIFLEFTRHRSTCEKIVEFLRESGNDKNILASNYLETFNKSSGPQKYDFVILAKICKKGSLVYGMERNPRGKCVIINNHVKYHQNSLFVDLDASGQLFRESIEFKNIFEQLCFEVELFNNINTVKIREVLNSIYENSRPTQSDALVVMIITHGADENILGFDACERRDDSDSMPISEVVNIFSEENCTYLKDKPKIFFFNCCRIKRSEEDKLMDKEEEGDFPVKTSRLPVKTSDSFQTKSDSFVCYSCAEGELSWNYSGRMSLFGEALSYSLKQYCGQESLEEVMSRTCSAMDQLLLECPDYKSRPEIRGHFMRRQLYFNPGFPEQD